MFGPWEDCSENLPNSICPCDLDDHIITEQAISDNAGIVSRAIHDLFLAKKRHSTAGEVSIHLTAMEIWNDKIQDLLCDFHGWDCAVADGVATIPVTSEIHVEGLIKAAIKKRKTARATPNQLSSLSHCICALHVSFNPSVTATSKSASLVNTDIVTAKLTLVDLAGSVDQEDCAIFNKDLLVFNECLCKLAEQSLLGRSDFKDRSECMVPYRDSNLTYVLRESFGGTCSLTRQRTTRLFCIHGISLSSQLHILNFSLL